MSQLLTDSFKPQTWTLIRLSKCLSPIPW